MNIAATVSNLFFCVYYSMGTTVSILVGKLLGAGRLQEAEQEAYRLMALSVCVCAGLGLLMFSLAPFIPAVYNSSDAIRQTASRLLQLLALLLPFQAFVEVCYYTLRSGGKSSAALLFDCVFVCFVGVPTAFMLSRFTDWELMGLFAAVEGLVLLKVLLGLFLLQKKKWLRKIEE